MVRPLDERISQIKGLRWGIWPHIFRACPSPIQALPLVKHEGNLRPMTKYIDKFATVSTFSNFNACSKWVEVDHTFSWVGMGTEGQIHQVHWQIWALCCCTLPVTINYFIFSLCFHMVIVIYVNVKFHFD